MSRYIILVSCAFISTSGFEVHAQPWPTMTAKVRLSEDPLHKKLVDLGYDAIPLIRSTKMGQPYLFVPCSVQGHKFTMIVDLESDFSFIEAELADQFDKLDVTEVPGVTNNDKVQEGYHFKLRNMRIGSFDTSKIMSRFGAIYASNNKGYYQKLSQTNPPCMGKLGNDMFRFMSAVINYRTNTMYIKTPWNQIKDEVEGTWEAVTYKKNGEVQTLDPAKPILVSFHESCVVHNIFGLLQIHNMHIDLNDMVMIKFFSIMPSYQKRKYHDALAIVKIENDKLTMNYTNDKDQLMPTDFTSPKGSHFHLIEFKRSK